MLCNISSRQKIEQSLHETDLEESSQISDKIARNDFSRGMDVKGHKTLLRGSSSKNPGRLCLRSNLLKQLEAPNVKRKSDVKLRGRPNPHASQFLLNFCRSE